MILDSGLLIRATLYIYSACKINNTKIFTTKHLFVI